jgi:mono/diheme cytochrome c family protein
MLRTFFPAAVFFGLFLMHCPGQAATITALKSLKLDVPTSDMMFPGGPGADAINNNCLACHSADHVMNQPLLSKTAWEEVVTKMIKSYKAPISSEDAEAIVAYLARVKGAP